MNSPLGYIHASAAVIDEAGILVRGPSGSGKTGLVLDLVDEARWTGRFARLVGDDRIGLWGHGDRLVARAHPTLAGLVERRGHGIGAIDVLEACVIRLVVDLCDETTLPALPRLPEPGTLTAEIFGRRLPRLALPARGNGRIACRLVFHSLGSFRAGS